MRYNFTDNKQSEDGFQATETTLLGRIRKRNSDVYLVIVERTRLDHLAYKFYDNPEYWWILAQANNVSGTMYVKPGTQIRIPTQIQEVLADHAKINS